MYVSHTRKVMMNIRQIRIKLQIAALQLEKEEAKGLGIPQPIIVELCNLVRDLENLNKNPIISSGVAKDE